MSAAAPGLAAPGLAAPGITEEAYAREYVERNRLVLRMLAKWGCSLDHQEDVAAAAWQRGWEKREQWRGGCQIYVWVLAIARNLFLSEKRKPDETPFEDCAVRSSIESDLLVREKLAIAHDAIPQRLWPVFIDLADGMTFGDISHETGRNWMALRSDVHRARQDAKSGGRRRRNPLDGGRPRR